MNCVSVLFGAFLRNIFALVSFHGVAFKICAEKQLCLHVSCPLLFIDFTKTKINKN